MGTDVYGSFGNFFSPHGTFQQVARLWVMTETSGGELASRDRIEVIDWFSTPASRMAELARSNSGEWAEASVFSRRILRIGGE